MRTQLTLLLAFLLGAVLSQHEHQEAETAQLPVRAYANVTTEDNGPAVITLRLEDKSTNTYVTQPDLLMTHDRYMHVVVVGEDLEQYTHVHPSDFPSLNPKKDVDAGIFRVAVNFTKNGRYLFAVDANTSKGEITKHVYYDHNVSGLPQMTPYRGPASPLTSLNTTTVDVYGLENDAVDGVPERYVATSDLTPLSDPERVNATKMIYEATLSVNNTSDTTELITNQEYVFRIHYRRQFPCASHAMDNTVSMWGELCFKDMNTLTNILGAPMHVVVIREGLGETQHLHGYVPNMNGASGEGTGNESHASHGKSSRRRNVRRVKRQADHSAHESMNMDMSGAGDKRTFNTSELAVSVKFEVEGSYKLVAMAKDQEGESAILTSHTIYVF